MRRFHVLAVIVIFGMLLAACSPGQSPTPAEVVPATGSTAAPTMEMQATSAPMVAPSATTAEMPTAEATVAPTEAPTVVPTEALVKPTSKELNLYGWSEYIPQELLDNFTKQYGIKVNYDTYSSNEEMLAKLQAGASGYDVVIPSDYTVQIMIKQNLLEPLDLGQIPNLTNVDPQFVNPSYDPGNKYSVPYQWGTVGLVYNSKKVVAPPSSWTDLWNPAYKGRVVLLDDEREVLGMVLTTLGFDKNSTDPNQLAQAQAKMKELLPNVKLFDSDSPKTALLSGEVWLGHTWNGEAALAHQQNPNILYMCPKEGCGIWFDNLAIPAGAPHKDAAQAFLNFVLQPDQSILITRDFPYSNPNKAALQLMQTKFPDMYKNYMGFPATNPSAEDIKNAKPVKDVGDATTLWDQTWTQVKGNQ